MHTCSLCDAQSSWCRWLVDSLDGWSDGCVVKSSCRSVRGWAKWPRSMPYCFTEGSENPINRGTLRRNYAGLTGRLVNTGLYLCCRLANVFAMHLQICSFLSVVTAGWRNPDRTRDLAYSSTTFIAWRTTWYGRTAKTRRVQAASRRQRWRMSTRSWTRRRNRSPVPDTLLIDRTTPTYLAGSRRQSPLNRWV